MKVSRLQKLCSQKGTVELLEFISQHPGATQKDLEAIADPSIVAERIEEFLNFRHCFLFACNDRSIVQKLFSLFPTSSVITEVGDHIIVYTHVYSSDIITRLFCTIYDMEAVEMIRKFNKAVIIPYHDVTNRMER